MERLGGDLVDLMLPLTLPTTPILAPASRATVAGKENLGHKNGTASGVGFHARSSSGRLLAPVYEAAAQPSPLLTPCRSLDTYGQIFRDSRRSRLTCCVSKCRTLCHPSHQPPSDKRWWRAGWSDLGCISQVAVRNGSSFIRPWKILWLALCRSTSLAGCLNGTFPILPNPITGGAVAGY